MKSMQHVEPNTDKTKVEKYYNDTNVRKDHWVEKSQTNVKKDIALNHLGHNIHYQKWQNQKYFMCQQMREDSEMV